MSNQILARTFAAFATVVLLAAGTAAADAHGMGMGHMSSGPSIVNFTQIKTTNLSTKTDNNVSSMSHDRRRFRFISVGATYVTPTTTCFYKHTIWGLAKICPDVDVVD
jgi:hypothetical protein